MTKASDNVFPKLILDGVTTDPAAPSDDSWKVFARVDGIYARSSNSTVGPFGTGGAGGDVATDAIWDAAGDLVQGTGANTAAKLSVGAVNKVVYSTGSNVAYAYPPGYEFDYVQYTAGNVAVTATTEATANTLVTGSAVVYDGSTTIEIEFFCPTLTPQPTNGIHTQIFLYDGSTSIGILGQYTHGGTNQLRYAVCLKRRLTPSSASHTYSIRAITGSGTATFSNGVGGSGAYVPMFIRQTKV